MKTEQQRVREKIDGFVSKYADKQIFGWKKSLEGVGTSTSEKKESYIQEGRVPLWCPKCELVMNKKLDNKMYWIHNMCFDCVIEFETKMRIEGKWEEYEKNKIKENIRSYIKETEGQVKEAKVNIEKESVFVNVVNESLGSVHYEKWNASSGDIENHKKEMDDILSKMYADFEETFGEKV